MTHLTNLVVINGLGGLGYLWDGLRAALPQVSIRVLDFPGHGDRPPSADYRYSALVEDVANRTADLEAFTLLGWSVGAAVAWLFAARHPGRVTRLVLLEPAAPHQSPFRQGPTPEPVHVFTYASVGRAAAVIRGIDPTTTEADILRSYRKNAAGRWEPRFDPAILPALVDDARDNGEEMYFELAEIFVPTLIIRGEHSYVRPEQVAEIAAELPDARVQTVAGAGHFLVKEQPQAVARLLVDFLSN